MIRNEIRYCIRYKCYDLAVLNFQMQVNLNMFNVFETQSGHLIVHTFNVFETKIVGKKIQIFNVFETKVVVNGQLVYIYFIDININF